MQTKLNNLFSKLNKEKYDKYLELIPDFKKEKTQKFTTIVLTIIAVIILAIFAINPTLSTIANLQKQLDDAKFVTEKLDEKINNLSALQTKYNSISSDLPTIYETIPQKPEAPKFTGQLQSLIQSSNLTIINLQISDIANSKDFSFYTFSLTAQGQYEDIINFLNKAVSMQRIITNFDISISQPSAENSVPQLNLRGKTIFKP